MLAKRLQHAVTWQNRARNNMFVLSLIEEFLTIVTLIRLGKEFRLFSIQLAKLTQIKTMIQEVRTERFLNFVASARL